VGLPLLVEEIGCLLHKYRIVLDEPFLDEGGLVWGHHSLHSSGQSVSQNFSDELGVAMHQTNGLVVLDIHCGLQIRKETDECRIQPSHVLEFPSPYARNCCHKLCLDDWPAGLVEPPCKAIRPQRFVGGEALNSLPNLLLGEGGVELCKLMRWNPNASRSIVTSLFPNVPSSPL
jgi:hypothetical protein